MSLSKGHTALVTFTTGSNANLLSAPGVKVGDVVITGTGSWSPSSFFAGGSYVEPVVTVADEIQGQNGGVGTNASGTVLIVRAGPF